MATGPQHYQRAEQLLTESRTIGGDDLDPWQLLMATLAGAQARATLALAAAVALSENGSMPGTDFDAWATVASADPAQSGRSAVWWLDDGHENPGEPELYLSEAAAIAAGNKQFREANFPEHQDAELTWTVFEEENGPDALELVAAGRCTGMIVRPVRPKAAA
jgi:hypothetical protein